MEIFLPGLALLLIALKLLGVITFSWFWVLAPLWVGLALGAIFLVFILMFAVVQACVNGKKKKR